MHTTHRITTCSLVLALFLMVGCTDSNLLETEGPTPTSASASPGLLANPASAQPSPAAPVYLSFDKAAVADGVWEGTVGQDVMGSLRTELTALRVAGKIWHVAFDWIVTAGDRSFTASLTGVLNTQTGRVTMNGTVVDGWLLGAQVHEEGQLVDADASRFQGTIRIMPATAR